ncbi:MAG: LamG-like jellyroll fold domain-containing protein, partial [Verrucomicrobiota bacterium]
MRYAIISDIHGNLPAWEQVYADMRSLNADVLICLGDVVGYGPKPQEVLDGIRSVTGNFVMGNHDAAASGIIDPSIFNDHAKAVVLWTRKQLNKESLDFLRNVPLEIENEDILFVHAEVPDPGRFGYIEDEGDAAESLAATQKFVTFVGHTHHPECFEMLPYGAVQRKGDEDRVLDANCRYVINVGSVGEPRNPNDIRARYVIYDDDTRTVYFRRVDFDANIYRQQLQESKLGHKPFFLKVLDKQAPVQKQETADMQVPAEAVGEFNTTQRRRLDVPDTGAALAGYRPKPATKEPASVPMPLWLSIIGVIALLIGGAIWWFNRPAPVEETDFLVTQEAEVTNLTSEDISDIPPLGTPTLTSDKSSLDGEFTLFASFKGDNKTLVAQYADGSSGDHDRLLYVKNGYITFQDSSDSSVTSSDPVNPSWEHHVGIISKEGKVRLFVDGEQQAFRKSGPSLPISASPIQVGDVSMLRVWNRSINTSKIEAATFSGETSMYGAINIPDDRKKAPQPDASDSPDETLTAADAISDSLMTEATEATHSTEAPIDDLSPEPLTPDTAPETEMAAQEIEPEVAEILKPQAPKYLEAHWKLDSVDPAGLTDPSGNLLLSSVQAGNAFTPIAPSPIPATGQENLGSVASGSWTESVPSQRFALTADNSFTLEGWVMISPNQPIVRIAGDATEVDGWKLEMKSSTAEHTMGGIRFVYNGVTPISAQAAISLFDPTPHHIAVVWDHVGIDDSSGLLKVYYDGAAVSEQAIPHDQIATPAEPQPFSLGHPSNPNSFGFDEFRFVHAALIPGEFLSDEPSMTRPLTSELKDTMLVNLTFDDPESPFKNTGTLGGEATVSGELELEPAGKTSAAGQAVKFSGENGNGLSIQIPAGVVPAGTDFTIAASVLLDGEQPNTTIIADPFFKIGGAGQVHVKTTTGQLVGITPALTPGWHRIVMNYSHTSSPQPDRGGTLIYLDGKLINVFDHADRVDMSGGFDLRIGSDPTSVGGIRVLRGQIDDL